MARRDRSAARRTQPLAPAVVAVATGMAVFAISGPSAAAVSAVSGGAFGELVDVTITDLGNVDNGPAPTVTLPPSGAASRGHSRPPASGRAACSSPPGARRQHPGDDGDQRLGHQR